MNFLAILLQGLLGFFGQRMAVRQAIIPTRRNDRRDVPEPAAPPGREAGYGWMNVASVYEPRRAASDFDEVPGVLENRVTRRGG